MSGAASAKRGGARDQLVGGQGGATGTQTPAGAAATGTAGPHIYPPRNSWKARLTLDRGRFIKDYSGNWLLPRLWGRLCLRWEERALTKLEGIAGVPAFLGRPTRDSLCLEAVPGVPLASLEPGEVGEAFIERLKALFAQIHARGVAHGDAHQRNILVHEDRPYLIDFSTAYVRGRLPVLGGYIFKCFVLLDQERLYKVEKRFCGRGTPPRMFLLYRIAKGWKQCRRR